MMEFLGGVGLGSFGQYEMRVDWYGGMAAQLASNADYWRRQQEGALNALAPTPEERAEMDRYLATQRHVSLVREQHGPDWAFWYWLCGLTLACAVRALLWS